MFLKNWAHEKVKIPFKKSQWPLHNYASLWDSLDHRGKVFSALCVAWIVLGKVETYYTLEPLKDSSLYGELKHKQGDPKSRKRVYDTALLFIYLEKSKVNNPEEVV